VIRFFVFLLFLNYILNAASLFEMFLPKWVGYLFQAGVYPFFSSFGCVGFCGTTRWERNLSGVAVEWQ